MINISLTAANNEVERRIIRHGNFSIVLDIEVPCLIWRLKGVPESSDEYRSSVVSFTEAFAHFKAKLPRLQPIVDGSAVGGIKPTDLRWANEFWAEKVREYGHTLFAMVRPKSIFGQIALDTYLSLPPDPLIEIRAFEDMEDAKRWIRAANSTTTI